jgi:hypothetical protein
MIIGEISFCDFVGYNIKSDDTKKYILDNIQNKYGIKIITKHFEKYDERLLTNLQDKPHLLSLRTNGNPYFLCLTKLNFVNYCIFIDKKIQQGYCFPRMIIAHFHFHDSLFDDTILDGEMVKNVGGTWSYLINDMIVHKGQHLLDLNVVRRLNMIYKMLANDFTKDENDICKIMVKKYFKYTDTQYILNEYVQTVPYTCRGIYFKPLFLKFKDILLNFDDNLIKKVERTKYKHVKSFLLNEDKHDISQNQSLPNNDDDIETCSVASGASSSKCSVSSTSSTSSTSNTINTEKRRLLVRKTNLPDVYELHDKNMVYLSYACVPSLTVSRYLRELFENKNIVDIVEVDCYFSQQFKKWLPIV